MIDGTAQRKEFIEGLHQNPREVWVAGRRVEDVTVDPVFRRPVQSIAELYELQTRPEHREVMTYPARMDLPEPRS